MPVIVPATPITSTQAAARDRVADGRRHAFLQEPS